MAKEETIRTTVIIPKSVHAVLIKKSEKAELSLTKYIRSVLERNTKR